MPHFETVYLGELRTENKHLASGTTIITDAPVDNHGKGEAFSPTDLTCISLATCIITTVGIWAQKEGVNLDGTKLEVSKTMQASPRKILKIGIVIHISNKQLSEEQKQRFEHIAYHCPVALSLHPDVEKELIFHY